MFVVSTGGDLPELVIKEGIVGTFIFICVSAFDWMDVFKANVDDMGDEEKNQSWQKAARGNLGNV